jgi:hypothetical protein
LFFGAFLECAQMSPRHCHLRQIKLFSLTLRTYYAPPEAPFYSLHKRLMAFWALPNCKWLPDKTLLRAILGVILADVYARRRRFD